MQSVADAAPSCGLKQIAAALRITKRAVALRAVKEAWRYQEIGGKKRVYALADLPNSIRAALLLSMRPAVADAELLPRGKRHWTEAQLQSEWAWYERLSQRRKDAAIAKLSAINAVEVMVRTSVPLMQARGLVSAQLQRDGVRGVSVARLGAAQKRLGNAPRHLWLALLADRYVGRTVTAECHPDAWDQLVGLYISRRENTFAICYERVARTAKANGWGKLPSASALMARIRREFTPQEIAYGRGGDEALDKMIPSMTRDRSMYAALEAVNGDAVLFVPWCIFPTGEVARPKVWFWQCLGTGKMLAWRADVSENTEMLRLAFGDLVERYGLPTKLFVDNTMAAANLKMTGGNAGKRWRQFGRTIKSEPILGVIPQCGVECRFTRPAHGQSKPIERAFRDLRGRIDHHPMYGKRGTKANPLPLAEWLAIMEAEVAAHNAQTGRSGSHFAGRSFDDVFAASYASVTVRKATEEQRRLWLLTAEHVTVNRRDGSICLGRGPQGENRYACAELMPYLGRKVAVRFDPQRLHEPVHVYTAQGTYIGKAECTWRGGFENSEIGQAYHREVNKLKNHTKGALNAKRRIDEITAAKMVPDVVPPTLPAPGVIQVHFGARPNGESVNKQPLQRTGTDDTDSAGAMCLEIVKARKRQAEERFE